MSELPAQVTTYALVVDDPDAPGSEPFVHWLLWNVPATMPSLPSEIPAVQAALDERAIASGTTTGTFVRP